MAKTKVKAPASPRTDTTNAAELQASGTVEVDTSATTEADTLSAIRILKQADTPKLSPRGKGHLTYEVGVTRDQADALLKADIAKEEATLAEAIWCRVTVNQSSGYFSNEWISLAQVIEIVDQQMVPFKAIIFRDLFERKGANNHGFLGAALKAEGLLVADDKQPLILSPASRREAIWKAMQTAIKEGHDLTDHVAKEKARKDAIKQQRLAEQKKRREANLAQVEDADTTTVSGSQHTAKGVTETPLEKAAESPENASASTHEG
ncbi:hypothetical protein GCM10022228_03770 [Halomonas cibimaris]|uniref:Uncharacterized protein n=1 Tax=Halomonas cibimaris TaxID=657012 RepID=A0ABP7LAN9_9GAMM